LNRRHLCAAWFGLHSLLIFLISGRQSISALVNSNTVLPSSWKPPLESTHEVLARILADRLGWSNPLRQALALYTAGTGIDTGYGFFAPDVASSHKLVFEIRYPDGRVEYELPHVGGGATGLRLTLLFDNIARARYPLLRETELKMMAFAVWKEHPDADLIRAVFGRVNPPTIEQFKSGEKETYEVLFAYDFGFQSPEAPPKP
jgi:hypothetical protein